MEATQATPVKYDMDVVRWFTIMAVVYAVIGTLIGVYVASELAFPFLNFDIPEITFGSASTAYQCGDFCVWWLCVDGDRFLYRATHGRNQAVEQHHGMVYVLWMEPDHRLCCDHFAAGVVAR